MNEETQNEIKEAGGSCCKKPIFVHLVASLVLLGLIAVIACGYMKYNQLSDELESIKAEVIELTLIPAETIEAVEDAEEEIGVLQTINLVQGLQLDIPSEWTVLSISEDEIEILTATEPYAIVETIRIDETGLPDAFEPFYKTDNLSLYNLGCAPAIGCYKVEINDMVYNFSWSTVKGTEPVPDNLDGPWFASANFDTDDVVEIMKTLR